MLLAIGLRLCLKTSIDRGMKASTKSPLPSFIFLFQFLSSAECLSEFRYLLNKGFPLFIQKLGVIIRGVFFAWILTQLGAMTLAAGGVVLSLFMLVSGFCIGLVSTVCIQLSSSPSSDRSGFAKKYIQHGLILSTLAGIFFAIIFWYLEAELVAVGQAPAIAALASQCSRVLAFAIFPFCWWSVLFQYCVSEGLTRLAMRVTLMSLCVALLFATVLCLGRFGVAPFGIAGIGIATLISAIFAFVLGMYYVTSHLRCSVLEIIAGDFSFACLSELWRLGWPIALKYCVESGFLFLAALVVGYISVDALAAQTLLQRWYLLSATFFGSLTSVVVARVGSMEGEHHLCKLPCLLAANFLINAAVILLLLALLLASLLLLGVDVLENSTVASLFLSCLPVIVAFQFLDAIRSSLTNILFSLKDTITPLVSEIVGLWVIGLPVATYVVYTSGASLRFFWLALLCGLFFCVFFLFTGYLKRDNAFKYQE